MKHCLPESISINTAYIIHNIIIYSTIAAQVYGINHMMTKLYRKVVLLVVATLFHLSYLPSRPGLIS